MWYIYNLVSFVNIISETIPLKKLDKIIKKITKLYIFKTMSYGNIPIWPRL